MINENLVNEIYKRHAFSSIDGWPLFQGLGASDAARSMIREALKIGAERALRKKVSREEVNRKALQQVNFACPHTREQNWPLDADDFAAHTNCDCQVQVGPKPCPDGLLPDGEVCPGCGGPRGPSGIDGGTWVHIGRLRQ